MSKSIDVNLVDFPLLVEAIAVLRVNEARITGLRRTLTGLSDGSAWEQRTRFRCKLEIAA